MQGFSEFSQADARAGTCDDNLRCRSGKLLMHPDAKHPHYTEVPAHTTAHSLRQLLIDEPDIDGIPSQTELWLH